MGHSAAGRVTGGFMSLELTEQEKNLLLELIDEEEAETILGINRADSREFRNVLRGKFELLSSIERKLDSYVKQAA
jgi:hypothetical protein